MTRNALILALLSIVCTCSSGCAGLTAFERTLEAAGIARFSGQRDGGSAVRVRSAGRAGYGAVIGPDRVLTVAHVVGDTERVWVAVGRRDSWVEARVIERRPSTPEDLLVLEVSTDSGWAGALLGFSGFSADALHTPADDGAAAWIATPRGRQPVTAASLRPGDSGSPVLDDRLRLVGLLSGRRGTDPLIAHLEAPPAAAGPVATTVAAGFGR